MNRFTVSLALKAVVPTLEKAHRGCIRSQKITVSHCLLRTSEQFRSTADEDMQRYSSTSFLSQ